MTPSLARGVNGGTPRDKSTQHLSRWPCRERGSLWLSSLSEGSRAHLGWDGPKANVTCLTREDTTQGLCERGGTQGHEGPRELEETGRVLRGRRHPCDPQMQAKLPMPGALGAATARQPWDVGARCHTGAHAHLVPTHGATRPRKRCLCAQARHGHVFCRKKQAAVDQGALESEAGRGSTHSGPARGTLPGTACGSLNPPDVPQLISMPAAPSGQEPGTLPRAPESRDPPQRLQWL